MKKLAILSVSTLLFALLAGCQIPQGRQRAVTDSTETTAEPLKIDLPLTKATAIQVALHYVGVPNEQVKHLHARLDRDDGEYHYDVLFRHGDYLYMFELSEETGEILKLETEHDRTELPKTQIAQEKAAKIALENEKLTEADVTALTVEFDAEDHRYEIKFAHNGTRYTYEVCAEYGKILDIDKEK